MVTVSRTAWPRRVGDEITTVVPKPGHQWTVFSIQLSGWTEKKNYSPALWRESIPLWNCTVTALGGWAAPSGALTETSISQRLLEHKFFSRHLQLGVWQKNQSGARQAAQPLTISNISWLLRKQMKFQTPMANRVALLANKQSVERHLSHLCPV